jgi:RecG-like helicase
MLVPRRCCRAAFSVVLGSLRRQPVKLVELSRFARRRKSKAALEGLAAGKIDLVIGTHKLLQSDVKFKISVSSSSTSTASACGRRSS